MTELSIWDEARPHLYAEYETAEPAVDQRASAVAAVEALFTLGDGLFEPLAVNAEVACCELEFGLPLARSEPVDRFHQLRLAAVPRAVGVPDIWAEPRVSRAERLDRTTVVRWVDDLLDSRRCPRPDTATGWTELIVEAVRARLPEAVAGVEGEELVVPEGRGEIRFPVDRAEGVRWVAGPLRWRSDTSPFHVRITNEGGALSLDWSRDWSPWIDAEGAGRPDVEAAVRRLTRLGWTVTSRG